MKAEPIISLKGNLVKNRHSRRNVPNLNTSASLAKADFATISPVALNFKQLRTGKCSQAIKKEVNN